MGITGDTAAVLAAAAKYTIIKAGDGVTDGRYVEGRSDAGDLADAVRRACAGAGPSATPPDPSVMQTVARPEARRCARWLRPQRAAS